MNINLEPGKKKALMLLVLIIIFSICAFAARDIIGPCATHVLWAIGFTLIVLGFYVLLWNEVKTFHKSLFYCLSHL